MTQSNEDVDWTKPLCVNSGGPAKLVHTDETASGPKWLVVCGPEGYQVADWYYRDGDAANKGPRVRNALPAPDAKPREGEIRFVVDPLMHSRLQQYKDGAWCDVPRIDE